MKISRVFSVVLFFIVSNSAISQNTETVVQAGHYGSVTASCFSHDGKYIITGSSDKTMILWRSSDGKQIRSFRGSNSEIRKAEFSSDGTQLLSLSANGVISIWDIETGKIKNTIKPPDDVFTCASFSPDGKSVVGGTRKSGVTSWSSETGEKLSDYTVVTAKLPADNEFDYPAAGSVSYSKDGSFIVAGVGDNTSVLWDAATGKEIRKYKKGYSSCTSCVVEAIITNDNKYIISSYSDSVKIFDLESGKLVRELFGQGGDPEGLTISSDNKYLAGFEYGVAEVWDLKSGKLISKFGNYSENKILTVAISPDGKSIIAGSEKRISEIFEIETGKRILTLLGYLNQIDERILTHPYMYYAALVNEAKLSPDGRFIAVGRTGNNAKLIDFKTGKVFKTLTGHKGMVISLCFSKDGKLLATGGLDGKAIVWDVETGTPVQTISFPDENMPIFSVDISNDGKMLATADWGGFVMIWDIATGNRLQAVSPHDRTGVYQVKFSPGDVYFISAGLDGKLKLTEIDTGEEIRTFTGHTDKVSSINMNPAGDKIITSGWDGTVRVWDFLSGLQVLKIKAHNGDAYSAKFDQSGKYIISGGDDFLVKEWDASNGKLIAEFSGHQGGVGDVNITNDLKYIVSGGRDGSVRIWNVADEKELLSIVFLNDNDWFIKNPGGYFDASEGAYKSISFVKGNELFSIDQFFNEFYRPGLYNEVMNGNSAAFRQNIMQTIDKFPPPGIEIVLPDAASAVNTPFATFMVKVTNNGGGVNEFKVMHNGKRQEVDASDLKRMTKAGQYAMKTFDLNLVPGDNEISVSAFSNGNIESAQKSVNVIYNGLQKTSDVYVLSIGINRYENENLNLTFARNDAEAFSSFMAGAGKKLFKNVNSYSLYDKDATVAGIEAKLDEIAKVMKKDDVFIFFYAGHGSTESDNFYFITSEITALYQQEKLKGALSAAVLQEKFRSLPALKQVVFIDACHSGSSVGVLAMRGATEEKALAQLSRSSGIHVMASSESDQQSAEIKTLGHGVFTYVLLEALNGKADGSPKDSKITVYELKSYIDDQVPEVSYRLIRYKQFPSTFSIGHDFPIALGVE